STSRDRAAAEPRQNGADGTKTEGSRKEDLYSARSQMRVLRKGTSMQRPRPARPAGEEDCQARRGSVDEQRPLPACWQVKKIFCLLARGACASSRRNLVHMPDRPAGVSFGERGRARAIPHVPKPFSTPSRLRPVH